MHPERNTGRFGVKTNQTLKQNSAILMREKAIGFYNVDGDQVDFSLNRHKAWELLDQAVELKKEIPKEEPNQAAPETENKPLKKNKMNKSKHDQRLEKKEVAKLKKQLEKKKCEEKEDNVDEEPLIQKRVLNRREYVFRGVNVPENGIVISETMSRGQLYKVMQQRTNSYNRGCKEESRKEKKENFVKSIML